MKVKELDIESRKKEIMLKAIVLLSEDGISADNKLGYCNYEIYCLLNAAKNYFIDVENYEKCAEIKDYMKSDEMQEISLNFSHYSEVWGKTKKIF
jgi:hypothetical protein